MKKLFSMLFGKKNADPNNAPDLVAHRNDPENLHLGFESISLVNGHAGTDVRYYAALHQVVIHQYCIIDRRPPRTDVKRIDIPEDITAKEDIIEYAGRTDYTVVRLARRK